MAALGCCSALACAAEPVTSATPAAPAASAQFAHADGGAIAEAELDRARGGADTTLVDTRLSSQVSGNSATQVQTGWNVINGGAFANLTGIPIVIQNSGANVAIQNATTIELQFK
ncbi:MAG: hypothetical protein ACJ8HI_05030 [Massilia sp.]